MGTRVRQRVLHRKVYRSTRWHRSIRRIKLKVRDSDVVSVALLIDYYSISWWKPWLDDQGKYGRFLFMCLGSVFGG